MVPEPLYVLYVLMLKHKMTAEEIYNMFTQHFCETDRRMLVSQTINHPVLRICRDADLKVLEKEIRTILAERCQTVPVYKRISKMRLGFMLEQSVRYIMKGLRYGKERYGSYDRA